MSFATAMIRRSINQKLASRLSRAEQMDGAPLYLKRKMMVTGWFAQMYTNFVRDLRPEMRRRR